MFNRISCTVKIAVLRLQGHVRCYCADTKIPKYIKIGKTSKIVKEAENPELVPAKYFVDNCSQNTLSHLQWMMKKDLLRQDMFLIGTPGPTRRRLVCQYAELTNQEVEYVVLSRDTTESDLKQRREIVSGTSHYEDQSAVIAALEGRILILDGIEKAERNVLPILNNLLENREIQLEDGRFLVSPEHYDNLLAENSQSDLDAWKLVRVSENFRVIALGLPVPQFRGHLLDPPFRSRFQARNIPMTPDEVTQELATLGESIELANVQNLFSLWQTLSTEEYAALNVPLFSVENVCLLTKVLRQVPNIPEALLLEWVYPYGLFLNSEAQKQLEQHLKRLNLNHKVSPRTYDVHESDPSGVSIKMQGKTYNLNIRSFSDSSKSYHENFVDNKYHNSILADMLLTHSSHDFCIIGAKGCGKTMLVKKFASLLNYPYEMVMLYKDMTARDLLQQRITDSNGNTQWVPSSLISSALNGQLVVLDGLHRLHQSTLAVLHSLIHDREVQLYDGTRLLRHDRYDTIKEKFEYTDEEMSQKKMFSVHKSFRVVALAEPPSLKSVTSQWLTPEVLSMFLFHRIRQLSLVEERNLIEQLVGPLSEKMEVVLNFAHTLHNSADEVLQNIGSSLSTRQLIRIAQRLSTFPHENIHSLISQTFLMKFLPRLARHAIEKALDDAGIVAHKPEHIDCKTVCKVQNGRVFIGNTNTSVYNPGISKVKVPNILFYDNPEHISIMESMLQDFVLGEHLLLVGNQGVGKNKVVDRFLQLLNRPREYIQLHRDTTVQSLTQQPGVLDGRIMYYDSPLVKAVQNGYVLVVDEADKAPTHVTCILKALVESGEMMLSDGRSIIHYTDKRVKSSNKDFITMHPDFRMIVLANRPGFPFLGNDFFSHLGDVFSCHAVENPSSKSEISMLKQYGPNVPIELLKRLVGLFSDLRAMSDSGSISYPYSIREVVNIVKHLEQFSDDGLPHVLKSVFDFDLYNKPLKDMLLPVFHKHGIPFSSQTTSIKIAPSFKLPELRYGFQWLIGDESKVPVETQLLKVSPSFEVFVERRSASATEARSDVFTEQKKHWTLPIELDNIPLDLVVTYNKDANIIHAVTGNPVSVYSLNTSNDILSVIDMSNAFPPLRRGFKPKPRLAALGGNLKNRLILFEKSTNQIFMLNIPTGSVSEIFMSNSLTLVKEKLSKMFNIEHAQKQLEMCTDLARNNILIFYSHLSSRISVIDLNKNTLLSYQLPDAVNFLAALDEKLLLINGKNSNFITDITNNYEYSIWKLDADGKFKGFELATSFKDINNLIHNNLNINNLESPNLLLCPESFVTITTGDLNSGSKITGFHFPRNSELLHLGKSIFINEKKQVIRIVRVADVQTEYKNKNWPEECDNCLEVTDLSSLNVSYIPITLPTDVSSISRWLAQTSDPYLLLHPLQPEGFVTLDAKGYIRIWETSQSSLQNSLNEWFKVTGARKDQQLTIERENAPDAAGAKHGKVDPTGAPHVGGNTWAGGTGGRDTAGLGGKGGPYRLDAGHNVFQLPDAEKDAVPLEIKKAAREMAQKVYKEKLKELEMNEHDAEMYDGIYNNVSMQVNTLRNILDSLQAKSKERQWLKHQTSGELDDTRLIEGITGDKNIYKKRGEEEPEMGSPQQKAKKLRLVVDVSGSMYRFNGHDRRLERELESMVLVMEAFDGYQDKFQYDIIGHSGEGFCIPFSQFSNPPKNKKEKMDLLQKMYLHSQFCMSGDNTLLATKHAIENISKEEADEHFVIVLSDANFDRYGISPKAFSNLLLVDCKVNSFAIFIGTLGDQADRLKQQLPPGRGFICFDTHELPSILQQIFTSAVFKE